MFNVTCCCCCCLPNDCVKMAHPESGEKDSEKVSAVSRPRTDHASSSEAIHHGPCELDGGRNPPNFNNSTLTFSLSFSPLSGCAFEANVSVSDVSGQQDQGSSEQAFDLRIIPSILPFRKLNRFSFFVCNTCLSYSALLVSF